jgi:4-amino-4-deoxy-L-arabinose transferase-like glycosyltransferase
MKKLFSWWVFTFLGILAFLLALFLRLVNLSTLPIFVDEAIYVRWAQVMRAESTLRFLPLSDGKPSLFMWTVIPFLKMFSDPLFAGRFVSVLSGLGTLVGVFVLAYILFNKKNVSLMAAFLYAVSPFTVFFDRMALVDSMLSMFGIWTAIFGILTVKYKRLDCAMVTGFLLGGAMLTKSPALFFEILLPTSLIFLGWETKIIPNLIKLVKVGALFVVTYVISQAIYNILRLGPNFQLLSQRNFDYVYPYVHIFQNPLDPFIPHLKDILLWFSSLGPSVLILLFMTGIIIGIKRFRKETLYLTIWVLLPLLAQAMYAKVFTARYIYFVIPYIFVISGLIFSERKLLIKVVGYIILIVFTVQSLVQNYHFLYSPEKANLPGGERSGYLEGWTSGYGLKEISLYLRNLAQSNPSRTIVVGTDGFFGTLPDGLQIYLNDLPQIKIVGVGVRFENVPVPLLESYKAGNPTFLIVNSTRFFIKNPQAEGLYLIKNYARAKKPDGTSESHLFFQLGAK